MLLFFTIQEKYSVRVFTGSPTFFATTINLPPTLTDLLVAAELAESSQAPGNLLHVSKGMKQI